MRLIFDSHLDLSWNALSFNRDQTESVDQINRREAGMIAGGGRGHATTSLPEMRKAGVAVCLGTLLGPGQTPRAAGGRPPPHRSRLRHAKHRLCRRPRAVGLLPPARRAGRDADDRHRQRARRALAAVARPLAEEPHERLPIGNILAMEGGDPIVDPGQVEAWFRRGLRSVMLSHYGQSHYSVGTGDNGPLTPRGIEMLKEFERVGMILDMTHLSDQSFFEALDRFSGPVMASHNNCRALVPGDRQFSDEQIRRLVERGAVIGVVCDAWMLEPGWKIGSFDVPRG